MEEFGAEFKTSPHGFRVTQTKKEKKGKTHQSDKCFSNQAYQGKKGEVLFILSPSDHPLTFLIFVTVTNSHDL